MLIERSLLSNTSLKCSNWGFSSFIMVSALLRDMCLCCTSNSLGKSINQLVSQSPLQLISSAINVEINKLRWICSPCTSITFVLKRWSWEVMWVCTDAAEVDTKTLQAAQWNISTFVMWSFSCRAANTTITMFLGFVGFRREGDRKVDVSPCFPSVWNKSFTLKSTVFYGSTTLTAFIQHDFLWGHKTSDVTIQMVEKQRLWSCCGKELHYCTESLYKIYQIPPCLPLPAGKL